MSHPKEIKVRLKGNESSHVSQFLIYEDDFRLSPEDEFIKGLIESARSQVKDPALFDECVVSIKMVF